MVDLMTDIRKSHVWLMSKTLEILGNILRDVPEETARTLRDGVDGWTILEVLCHLRDFDRIFRERAQMMLDQEMPDLPAYDHEQMAIDNAYNEQSFAYVFSELVESRHDFIAFFKTLDSEEWEREGKHPERERPFSMTDALMQVGLHDADHLEQITRILEQATPDTGVIAPARDDA
jgi:uncharacterized damage-inducible protein DinB